MSNEPSYKNYVKRECWDEFKRMCHKNSLDFYGVGCLLTAHLVMNDLMAHTYKGVWKQSKMSPKEAWESAFEEFDGHSGASASFTALIIAKYSPRGEEFKKWCKKNDVVVVKWE